ncbi:MAG: acetyl-CoA carboxylase biotin carboxyl carrier protein subunit [Nocardioidaceae bacterium]|nr:acetyl-CoA carboxylase biotin carboxyl carrier protein subunit [Nocardioidaceae bacterium]MCL2613111.1 acetyl-CoA carboxylase biotin carboxyl carrier protein subunit [Nocardioidaceae bacterium]
MNAVAPIVSTIWRLDVAVGQRVEVGQQLALLESMKMEIPVSAPVAGVVADLPAAIGQIVQEGDPVAVISPA